MKGNAFSTGARGRNEWAILDKRGRIKARSEGTEASEEEARRMKRLFDWWHNLNGGDTSVGYVDERRMAMASSTSPNKQKERPLAEARPGVFMDVTVKVSKRVQSVVSVS